MVRHTLTRLGLAAATVLALAVSPAHAANFSKTAYDGAKKELNAGYKASREACDKLDGNAKDVCVEQAKGQEKVALAQLEYNYTGSDKDALKLYEARYEAVYAIEKEKCDDRTGNDKDVCLQAAKTGRDKAKADVKLAKKTAAATEDAIESHLKAEYKLAKEKCDALSGDAKDMCMASAKARYHVAW